MEFNNEFTVPAGIDTAFAVLSDLERVAPCLPGAVLEEVDGSIYTGRVKVKLGPIQVLYRGTAELVELDQEAKRARILASGSETRGAGTASAEVTATLRPSGPGVTTVTVLTDLDITGKPAQFGRGVMEDVGTRIIDSFAERLAELLDEDTGTEVDVATARQAQEADALDLLDLAGGTAVKRVAPVVAAVLAVLGFIWWVRRR